MTCRDLVVTDLTKTYRTRSGRVTALREVTFTATAGEFICVSGVSGSGKSTLLSLCAGLDRPDRGDIRFGDSAITRLSSAAAARFRNQTVGMIFQAYNLLPQLNALENVLAPMVPTGRVDRAFAHQLLDAVGLADRARHRPAELSGGEQQRVAVARALVNDPSLLLADEPTGNLDPEAADSVLDLLATAGRERGCTVLLATHSPEAATRADTIIRLEKGDLCATDTES